LSADLNSEKGYRHYSIGKHLLEAGSDVRGLYRAKKEIQKVRRNVTKNKERINKESNVEGNVQNRREKILYYINS